MSVTMQREQLHFGRTFLIPHPWNKPSSEIRKLCNDLFGDDMTAVSNETLLE